MKKLLIPIVFAFSITSTTFGANNLQINQSVLSKMKDLGIAIQNTITVELEPIEFLSYSEYTKKDLYHQKSDEAAWSTIWHNNLDKFEATLKCSSLLKGYPVTNLLDKRIDTAWVEGSEGDGIGEWVSININAVKDDRPVGMLYFGMIPGYLKSDKSWEENNRIKTALLVIETYVGYNIKKGVEEYEYPVLRLKFKDYKGLQVFDLLDYGAPPTFEPKRLWLIIEDVYKGTKYRDTCISEVVITGTCAPYQGGESEE